MKAFRSLFRFLSGVYFAAFLLFTAALVVAVATFIESKSGSHRAAERLIYSHPLFYMLLGGFFLNILLSAIKRYPFKKRHVPFLLAHLGLLLMITGTVVKNIWGVQGYLVVKEGQTKSSVFLPYTYALKIEKRPSKPWKKIETAVLPISEKGKIEYGDLSIVTEKIVPHASTSFNSFLHQNHMQFSSLPPFSYTSFPLSLNLGKAQGKARLYLQKEGKLSSLLQDTVFSFYSFGCSTPLFQGTLWQMKEPFHFEEKENTLLFFQEKTPLAKVEFSQELPKITLLSSSVNDLSIAFSQAFCALPDSKSPTLTFLSSDGILQEKSFPHDALSEIAIYDRGFGGYCTLFPLPFSPYSFEEQKTLQEIQLLSQLESYLDSSSPAAFFINAWAKEHHLPPSFLAALFLSEWRRSHKLLLTSSSLTLPLSRQLLEKLPKLDPPFSYFALSTLSFPTEFEEAAKWKEKLPEILQKSVPEHLETPEAFSQALQELWHLFSPLPPAADSLSSSYDPALLLTALFALDGIYPAPLFPTTSTKTAQIQLRKKAEEVLAPIGAQATLFSSALQEMKKKEHALTSTELSAFLLSSSLIPLPPLEEEFFLESPVVQTFSPEAIPVKEEEARPLAFFSIRKGKQKERLALSYDAQTTRLPWPFLEGAFRARFQPQEVRLPFSVRLQNAQTIYLPGTGRPAHYLADVLIAEDGAAAHWEEISMNRVYEQNGWRLYLSSLTPQEEGVSKTAVFAVNYDPAKWWLTYPGALSVAMGLIGLFWLRKSGIKR